MTKNLAKIFKKVGILFCTLFLITMITSRCGKNDDLARIEKRGRLIVGVRTDTKPFGYRDINGTIQGYDIDLAKYIAKALLGDMSAVEFVPVTAENRVEKLNSHKVDILIATMSVTNQRHLVVDFSDPYYIAGQALMVRDIKHIYSLRHLNGRRVIIVYGSTGEDSIKRNVPEATVLGFKNYPTAFDALVRGQGDALIADDIVLINYQGQSDKVKLLPYRYSREPYAIAFRRGEASKRLQNRVNYTLTNLKNMGVFRDMERKWGIERKIK